MKTVIITGVSGQDGLYLSELLSAKGYRVVGAVRDLTKARKQLAGEILCKVELVEWDMLDQQNMVSVLSHYQPDEIYNFAACSSGAGMFDDAVGMGEVNGIAVTRIMDAIRNVDPRIRFCQASSSELFGDAVETPQSETSTFRPRSPYGAAKLYAHSMVEIYRNKYNLFACSAILFNHESPRRGLQFVTRKVSREVAKIKLGLVKKLTLGNLEARRDWGFAGDYVRAMWEMLQRPAAEDYVISSGETHSVLELCEIAFSHVGLDHRNYVEEAADAYRPDENIQLVGDSQKARDKLGWIPEVGFRDLITRMVDADLHLLAETNGNDS